MVELVFEPERRFDEFGIVELAVERGREFFGQLAAVAEHALNLKARTFDPDNRLVRCEGRQAGRGRARFLRLVRDDEAQEGVHLAR